MTTFSQASHCDQICVLEQSLLLQDEEQTGQGRLGGCWNYYSWNDYGLKEEGCSRDSDEYRELLVD